MKRLALVPGPALALCVATLTACPGDDTSATTSDGSSTGGSSSGAMPTVTSPTVTVGMTMGMDGTSTGGTTMEMTTAVDTTGGTTEGSTGGTTEGSTGGSTAGSTGGSTAGSTGGSTGGSTSTGMAMDCTVGGCTPDEEICNAGTGLCEGLYACVYDSTELDRINVTTFAELSTVTMSDAGGVVAIGGCNGMATDVVSGDMYVVSNDGSGGDRRLGTVDPSTGSVTMIGAFTEEIAGIAFDDAGTLYALSGQAGITTTALFTVDTATAALTLVVDVANTPVANTDGEALAFSPMTSLAYRWSGNGDPKLFASIDPGTMILTSIPPTLVSTGEVVGATFVRGGPLADRFLISTRDNEAISVQTNGTYTNEGTFGGTLAYYKGLAFSPN